MGIALEGTRGGYSPGYQPPQRQQTQQGTYAASQQAQDPLLGQLNQLWQYGQAAGAGQNAQIDQQLLQRMQQLGLLNANQQTQSGLINQGANISGQRIDLSGQGLDVQRGALSRAQALLPQQHALTNEGLAEQLARAQFSADQSNRNLTSQGTVAGSLQSQGARQGFSDIGTQLGFATQDVSRAQRGEDLNYGEQQAQLGDRGKQLDLAAKGLGLDREELTNRTQSALQQLGLSTALGTSDVVSAMNDLNAGRYNPIQNILPYIYQLVGVRPTAG